TVMGWMKSQHQNNEQHQHLKKTPNIFGPSTPGCQNGKRFTPVRTADPQSHRTSLYFCLRCFTRNTPRITYGNSDTYTPISRNRFVVYTWKTTRRARLYFTKRKRSRRSIARKIFAAAARR